MNDDLRRGLEEAGERAVPEPRTEFARALEDRLLTQARSRPVASPAGASPAGASPAGAGPAGDRRTPPNRRTLGYGIGLAGITAVLAIAVIGLFGGLGPRSTLALELTDSVNVEVALTDGTTLVDPDGMLLPDGAIVHILAGGSARVGDLELQAGDVATITDRRIDVQRGADATASAEATPTARETPRTTRPPTSKPTDPPASDEPKTPRPDPSKPPSTTATPAAASPEPTPSATPKPSASPEPTPSATPKPSATSKPAVRKIRLEARRTGPSELRATWTAVAGASRYVLVGTRSRDGVARNPIFRRSPVIGVFTHPPRKPLPVRVGRDVVEVRLLVVALSEDGRVVGRSAVVVVAAIQD